MKKVLCLLLLLAACSSLQTPNSKPQTPCPTLTVWNGTACCQDIDSNRICDNKDPAVLERLANMPAETPNPPTPVPKPIIVRKPTIITQSLERIKEIKSYKYTVNNYDYFVVGQKITLSLPVSINVGKVVSENQTYPAMINKIVFDRIAKTAIGECSTPAEFVKYAVANPCDKLQGITFKLNYSDYATFKTPEDLLAEFELDYPFEVLEKQHVGKRLATLAVFRKNRQNQSLLWLDAINSLPIKYQRVENGEPVETLEFVDLFVY